MSRKHNRWRASVRYDKTIQKYQACLAYIWGYHPEARSSIVYGHTWHDTAFAAKLVAISSAFAARNVEPVRTVIGHMRILRRSKHYQRKLVYCVVYHPDGRVDHVRGTAPGYVINQAFEDDGMPSMEGTVWELKPQPA